MVIKQFLRNFLVLPVMSLFAYKRLLCSHNFTSIMNLQIYYIVLVTCSNIYVSLSSPEKVLPVELTKLLTVYLLILTSEKMKLKL